jgi:KilA-N domain
MPQKTAIIYRPLFDLEVKQEVDSMLYNITDIATAYEKKTGNRKDTSDFMKLKTTKDYVDYLENLKTGNLVFKSMRGKY